MCYSPLFIGEIYYQFLNEISFKVKYTPLFLSVYVCVSWFLLFTLRANDLSDDIIQNQTPLNRCSESNYPQSITLCQTTAANLPLLRTE